MINTVSVLSQKPNAVSIISGSEKYKNIHGIAKFYYTMDGVLVYIQVSGLPSHKPGCTGPVFAVHIHEGNSCSGTKTDPFANAKMHYNPDNCKHPYHAGDMPPLFGNNGQAVSVFLTDRFTLREIIGKTIIIHSEPDDFTSQPSGNAGEKIACGVIK